jgi:hypothetical protein
MMRDRKPLCLTRTYAIGRTAPNSLICNLIQIVCPEMCSVYEREADLPHNWPTVKELNRTKILAMSLRLSREE